MLESLQEALQGKIDFEGQKLSENILRVVLVVATVVSFILGFALQSQAVTLGVFGGAVLLALALVLPPWPMYNAHPVKWLSKVQSEEAKKTR